MDERMHDRDDDRGRGDRRGRGRDDERPRYGGGWHEGTAYGSSGGYGRYDDRPASERERERYDERRRGDERRERRAPSRYDYGDIGYGGSYDRDRDDRRGGGFAEDGRYGSGRPFRGSDDRSGYERHGEGWRRDTASRPGRSREANWGSAFNAGEYGRNTEGLGYSSDRPHSGRDDRQGRPSDYRDERGDGRFREGSGWRDDRWRGEDLDRRRSDRGRDDRDNHDRRRFEERGYDERRFDERRYDQRRFDERPYDEGRHGQGRSDGGRHDDRRHYESRSGADHSREAWRHSHDRQRFDEPSPRRREQMRDDRWR